MIRFKALRTNLRSYKKRISTIIIAGIISFLPCSVAANYIVSNAYVLEEQIQLQIEPHGTSTWIVRTGSGGDLFGYILKELPDGWQYRAKEDYGYAFDAIVQTDLNSNYVSLRVPPKDNKSITFWAFGRGSVVKISTKHYEEELTLSSALEGGELFTSTPFETYSLDNIITIVLWVVLTFVLYTFLLRTNWTVYFSHMMNFMAKPCRTIDYAFGAILTAIFFSITPVFTFDSIWYHVYFDIFNGIKPITDWDPTRGFAFPLILYLTTELFGYTTQAMQIMMYLSYLLMIALCFLLARMIMPNLSQYRIILWTLFSVFLFLNPIVVGYYHIVLTEVILNTVVIFILFFCIKTYQHISTGEISYKRYISTRLVSLSITVILSYFIKQTYLVVVLLPMLFTDLYYVLQQETIRKKLTAITGTGLCLLVMLSSIIAINSKWNEWIDIDNAITIVGTNSTTTDVLAQTLTDGLRYFDVQDNGDTIEVSSMQDNEVQTTREIKKLEHPVLNSIKIIGTALRIDSSNVIRGYIDNYLAIANIYFFPNQLDRSILSKEVSFTRAAENRILAAYPRLLTQGEMVYEKGQHYCDVYATGVEQYEQRTDTNPFIQAIYCETAQSIANFLFSMMILLLLPCWCVTTVALVRSKYQNIIMAFLSMTTGSAFGYIVFLSCTGQTIDRYASIWYIPLLLVLGSGIDRVFGKLKYLFEM